MHHRFYSERNSLKKKKDKDKTNFDKDKHIKLGCGLLEKCLPPYNYELLG